VAGRIGVWSRRQVAHTLVRRAVDLHVSGLNNVPEHGPAILVARHYHHLYDAAAILASVRREVHVLVAVDWLGGAWRLALMRRLAATARWPVVWRHGPAWRINREGYRASLEILNEGRVLLVFPEGYPNVDPLGTPKQKPEEFLPFDPGFLVLAERANGGVSVIPVGLSYARSGRRGWTLRLRFGPPIRHRTGRAGRRLALQRLEFAVRELSGLAG
jgi:putative membrane protein